MKKKLIVVCAIALIAAVYINCNYVWYNFCGFVNINAERVAFSESTDYDLPVDFRVKRLKNLRQLELRTDKNSDLSFLSDFHYLEGLWLFAAGGESGYGCSLETLPEIPSVKSFSLFYYMNENLDGASIARLENAEFVYLGVCNVCDYSFVSEMKNLKDLCIDCPEHPSNFIPNGEPVQGEYGKFDWSGLAYSESLEYFSASNIEYDPVLLEALEKIPTLNYVELYSFGENDYSRQWAEEMSEKGVTVVLNGFKYEKTS